MNDQIEAKPVAERPERNSSDLKLRLPESLRVKIVTSAKARGVSMNTEMIERLECSFSEGVLAELDGIMAEVSMMGDFFRAVKARRLKR